MGYIPSYKEEWTRFDARVRVANARGKEITLERVKKRGDASATKSASNPLQLTETYVDENIDPNRKIVAKKKVARVAKKPVAAKPGCRPACVPV